MELQEVKDLLTVIRLNYPQSFRNYTKGQSEAYLKMMYEAFKDDPTQLVVSAVKSIMYGDAREFAPNIGQIKTKMFELANTDMTAQEAWLTVKKALRNCGYFAQEEYEKLPPVIQKLTDPQTLHDWAMMDTDTLDSVIGSNFMRSYQARVGKDREYQMLPNDVKVQIDSLVNSMKLIGGGDD